MNYSVSFSVKYVLFFCYPVLLISSDQGGKDKEQKRADKFNAVSSDAFFYISVHFFYSS